MENHENNKEVVTEKINSGEFCTVKRKSKSDVFNIFMNIKNADGNIIEDLVICERCKNLYKCNDKCVSNLSRHQCYKKYKMEKDNKSEEKVQPTNV